MVRDVQERAQIRGYGEEVVHETTRCSIFFSPEVGIGSESPFPAADLTSLPAKPPPPTHSSTLFSLQILFSYLFPVDLRRASGSLFRQVSLTTALAPYCYSSAQGWLELALNSMLQCYQLFKLKGGFTQFDFVSNSAYQTSLLFSGFLAPSIAVGLGTPFDKP